MRSPLPSLVTITGLTGFRDQEVGAGDADVGVQKSAAQHRAGIGQETIEVVGIPVLEAFMVAVEEFADLAAVLVDSRCYDVTRCLAGKLHDIFAQIGFDGFDACGFEPGIEADLLAHHGLALGDDRSPGIPADLQDDPARLGVVPRPVNLTAGGQHSAFECHKVGVEMIQHMILDGDGLVAQCVELG